MPKTNQRYKTKMRKKSQVSLVINMNTNEKVFINKYFQFEETSNDRVTCPEVKQLKRCVR